MYQEHWGPAGSPGLSSSHGSQLRIALGENVVAFAGLLSSVYGFGVFVILNSGGIWGIT